MKVVLTDVGEVSFTTRPRGAAGTRGGRALTGEQSGRWSRTRAWLRRTAMFGGATLAVFVGATSGTQDAAANGDTRTLTFHHMHTKETATVTFRRYGRYDPQGLQQLNWMLRDWRSDEQVQMDPRLFDLLWEVHKAVGSDGAVHVQSAYRSPNTNAMLRRRSRGVAKHSQHMAGKAVDFFLPDVSINRVREVAMRMQNGGVGWYPGANFPFVHLDVGSVRSWPRMTRDQLARLFPGGRTVHIPADGKPMPGYEEARAEIVSRGGSVAAYAELSPEESGGRSKSLWAALFGGDDEDAEYLRATQPNRRGRAPVVATAYAPTIDASDSRTFFAATSSPVAEPPPEVAAPVGRRGRPVVVASAEAPALPPAVAGAEPETAPVRVAAPLPPRRPDDLEVAVAAPLPPVRPAEFAVAVATALPGVPGAESPIRLAAHPVPPLRPSTEPTLAMREAAKEPSSPAKDRTHLKALFVAAATLPEKPEPARVVASRSRARSEAPVGAVGHASTGVVSAFAAQPTDLSPTRFAGPAVAPLPTAR